MTTRIAVIVVGAASIFGSRASGTWLERQQPRAVSPPAFGDSIFVDTVELEDSADTFVTVWERAFLTLPRGAGDPCLDRRNITNGPAVSGPERPGCLP